MALGASAVAVATAHRIDAHFAVIVPIGRSISPITQKDWEGVGVKPDVEDPPQRR